MVAYHQRFIAFSQQTIGPRPLDHDPANFNVRFGEDFFEGQRLGRLDDSSGHTDAVPGPDSPAVREADRGTSA